MEGEGTLFADLKEYPVTAQDLITISPNCIHAAVGKEQTPLRCKVIIADLDMLMGRVKDETVRMYTHPLAEQKVKITPDVCRTSPLYAQMKELFEEIMMETQDKNQGWELYVKAYLMQLLGTLFREQHYTREEQPDRANDVQRVKRAIEYIEKNMSHKICLDELAKYTGYSRHYFMHFFKQYTGYTVTQYLNQ